MTTILSLLLVLDLSGLGKFAPAILVLLEGGTFLAGFASMRTARFMFGMWGMYFQSKWYPSRPHGGFHLHSQDPPPLL